MEDFLRSLRTRDGTASTSLLMDKDKEKAFIDNLITVREQVCLTDTVFLLFLFERIKQHCAGMQALLYGGYFHCCCSVRSPCVGCMGEIRISNPVPIPCGSRVGGCPRNSAEFFDFWSDFCSISPELSRKSLPYSAECQNVTSVDTLQSSTQLTSQCFILTHLAKPHP